MALPFSPLTSLPGHTPTPTPTPTPTVTPTPTPTSAPSVVTTTLSNTQSSTTTSSSSSYASTTSTSSSSSSHKGLSTGAQTGISLGIVFFLILCVLVFYNLKRLYQRAREKDNNQPALPMSEVNQYLPPQSVTYPGGNPSPPPPPPSSSRLGTTYPDSADISSAAPLLSHNSYRNSYPVSTQNRYSTLSQTTDPHQIVTQDLPTFPNPHDPFSAPARTASFHSLTHSTPHDASASAAMTVTSDVLAVGSSSNSQSERRLSVLHADMTRYQKELEFEHKRSLEQGQEPHDPPPQYPS